MPWKEASNPYHVWLSEIILQQTRVAQGLPYFERFIATYPNVTDLAAAEDDAVMKLWEGLGYYSRARNLLKAARVVAEDYGGHFPDTYTELLALPGIGPYTAAAIASFAFGEQVAVLDGNVYRVLARYAADGTPAEGTVGRKHFQQLVDEAMGDTDAAKFNQAIMDFGALVCTPKRADCQHCPLAADCAALAQARVYDLPVKSKKGKRRRRHFHYLVITDGSGHYAIQSRDGKDIWRGLYQFPLIEADRSELDYRELKQHPQWPSWLSRTSTEYQSRSKVFKHQLTHQEIDVVFHEITANVDGAELGSTRLASRSDLRDFAFPRVINRYLDDRAPTLGF